jgi:tripartite-type tricarboxylate transporter receptor subunit TctC
MLKKTLRVACLFTSTVIFSLQTWALDAYPSKPIQIIVPYTPGGNTDLLARVIAQKLTDLWGKPVIIDNRPGAGGTIGIAQVAKSKADGYTLALGSFGNILVANSLYKGLSYEPLKDLVPIILLSTPPTVLVVPAKFPVKDVKSLINYAKENPDAVHYSSSGNGTSNHLFGELFAGNAKIKMSHVPYKGSSPAINDLIAGVTQLNFAPFPLVLQHIQTGGLKALAVSGPGRSSLLPNIPTVTESGLTGYVANGWFALMTPKETPKDTVMHLNATINQILQSPEVKKNLESEGADPIGGSPEDAQISMEQGIKKWQDVINKFQIKLD